MEVVKIWEEMTNKTMVQLAKNMKLVKIWEEMSNKTMVQLEKL